jgi:DNA-binding transcriptional MerR regulator
MANRLDLIAIGELARRAGLASSALRYYERIGLLSPAARAGGRRYYTLASVERVALVQLCQDAGFTLREIRSLLAARSRRPTDTLAAKLRELDERITRAQRAKALVQHALNCQHRSLFECPRFQATLKAYLGFRGRPGNAANR